MTNAQARRKLKAIDARTGRYYDALTDTLERELDRISTSALARLVSSLTRDLSFTPLGFIARTNANLTRISRLDREYKSILDDLGRRRIITSFVNEFPGTLSSVAQQLRIISSTLKGPPLQFREIMAAPSFERLLTHQSKITVAQMEDVAGQVAVLAKRKVLLQYGALNREDTADLLAASLSRSVPETRTLGATGLAMFHRTAQDRIMQEVDPEGTLLYVYDGPDDKLTRPFCHQKKQQMTNGRSWTRDEIDAMDNGQLPDVFTTCGGYNCRHQWRLALPDETMKNSRRP